MAKTGEQLFLRYRVGEDRLRQLFSPDVKHCIDVLLAAAKDLERFASRRFAVEIDHETFTIELDCFVIESLDELRDILAIGHPPVATNAVYNRLFPVGPRELAAFGETQWELGRFSVKLILERAHYGFLADEHDRELIAGMRIRGRFPKSIDEEELDAFRASFKKAFSRSVVGVLLNGRPIREDDGSKKWHIDDSRYRIQWNAEGPLNIYSEGQLVKSIPREDAGLGGDIVMTQPLLLNRDRTDIALKTPDVENVEQRIGVRLADDHFAGDADTDDWQPPERESVVGMWLQIAGEDIDPDEVTSQLGRRPDRQQRKGQVLNIMTNGEPNISRCGCWMIVEDSFDPTDKDLQDALEQMLDTLPSDLAVWRRIAETAEIELFVDIYMGGCDADFSIAPETLNALGERGIEIVVSILDRYTWDPIEDQANRDDSQ